MGKIRKGGIYRRQAHRNAASKEGRPNAALPVIKIPLS